MAKNANLMIESRTFFFKYKDRIPTSSHIRDTERLKWSSFFEPPCILLLCVGWRWSRCETVTGMERYWPGCAATPPWASSIPTRTVSGWSSVPTTPFTVVVSTRSTPAVSHTQFFRRKLSFTTCAHEKCVNFVITEIELLKFECLASKNDTIRANIEINGPKFVYT